MSKMHDWRKTKIMLLQKLNNNKLKNTIMLQSKYSILNQKKNESYMSKIFMLQLIHIYKRNDSLNKIMNISKLNYFINKETNFKCL